MSATSLLLAWLACICTSLVSASFFPGTRFAAAEAAEPAAEVNLAEEPRLLQILCLDSCRWANDTVCQDGGWGASGPPSGGSGKVCEFGTDCADCGFRETNMVSLASAILS